MMILAHCSQAHDVAPLVPLAIAIAFAVLALLPKPKLVRNRKR